MASSSPKSWPLIASPWGRRRAESHQSQKQVKARTTAPEILRCWSAVESPISPVRSAYPSGNTAQLQSPPTGRIKRRRTRLSSLIRRQRPEYDGNSANSTTNQQYIAYSPQAHPPLPGSAPSVVTAVTEEPTPGLPPTHPYASVSPSLYGSPKSDPTSTTTLYKNLARGPWEGLTSGSSKSFHSMGPAFSYSPVSYVASAKTPTSPTNVAPTKRLTSSSDPGAVQRSVSTTAVSARRDSETGSDTFVSPLDFALFAEAMSSLSIGDIGAGPVEHSTIAAQQASPPRVGASQPASGRGSVPSLPALSTSPSPQRSSSLPPCQAQQSTVRPSPSRTQLASEALIGVGGVDEDGGSEDELPDYSQSQREANARHRWEATKRARELDEAWRRGRRG